MEVLHLEYLPGTAGWVLPLQSRLQQSPCAVLQERYRHWKEVGLADLGIAVATRLSLTLRASSRLAELIKTLRDEIEESGEIDDLLAGGFVYPPKDSRVFYDICMAVDSFYFEFRSCYEVIGKFVRTFGHEMLGRGITQDEIIRVLKDTRLDTDWVTSVRENRKLFFHETAPWIALQIRQRRPLECSLLIMKEIDCSFKDPEEYITQQELADTVQLFQRSIWAVRTWLEQQLTQFEASLSA